MIITAVVILIALGALILVSVKWISTGIELQAARGQCESLKNELAAARLEIDWKQGRISSLKSSLKFCMEQPTYDENDPLAGMKVIRDQVWKVLS